MQLEFAGVKYLEIYFFMSFYYAVTCMDEDSARARGNSRIIVIIKHFFAMKGRFVLNFFLRTCGCD